MIYDLGEKLKTLRLQHGYSQKYVYEITGISQTALSGYETGEKTPSLEKLLKLSNLYQVSTDYLLGVTKTNGNQFLDASSLTTEQFMLLKQFLDSMKK